MSAFSLIANYQENTVVHQGFEFKYILKERKYDADHLIVVFSGFGGRSDFTYDFKKSLKSNRSYVLWIKDDFYNNDRATYYVDPVASGLNSSKALEEAICSFIIETLNSLNISKDKCTLLGASKGGASALYYGLKYDFKNILVSAPVLKIGSSVAGLIPKSIKLKGPAKFMLGEELPKENIDMLDAFIINALHKDKQLDKNIYFLASEVDERYEGQQQPFIPLFKKYKNFNFIKSESELVRKHQDVTSHNAPLILNILGVLSFNIPPVFPNSIIVSAKYPKEVLVTKEPVLHFKKINFCNKGFLYPEGVFFLRGLSCESYEDFDYELILKSKQNAYNVKLAKGNSSLVSREYFEHSFVNYDKAVFCTKSYAGLNMESIAAGLYEVYIRIVMKTGDEKALKLGNPVESNNLNHNTDVISQRIFYENGTLFYEKKEKSIQSMNLFRKTFRRFSMGSTFKK